MNSEVILRAVQGGGVDSRLIEFRCGWCSHVEAIGRYTKSLTFGAQFFGGVGYRHQADKCYRHTRKVEVWHIPCTSDQRSRFWDFMDAQDGKPYDWKAIAGFAIGQRTWDEPNAWFCSELVMAALKESGIWQPQGQVYISRIDPDVAYLVWTSLAGAWKEE